MPHGCLGEAGYMLSVTLIKLPDRVMLFAIRLYAMMLSLHDLIISNFF